MDGRGLLLSIAIALALVAGTAGIADADVDAAKKAFTEGVKRFQRGDYEAARDAFLEADRQHHSPVIAYNLGLAEEHLGRPQAAVEAYERYLAEAGEDGEFAQAAAVAVAQVRARSGRLHLSSTPAGARVFINGQPQSERTPSTLLVTPGHHFIVVEGDGWRADSYVDIEGGATKQVELKQPPTKADEKPTTEPTPNGDVADLREREIVWGAQFQVLPYGFFARANGDTTQRGASGIFVGLSIDAGFSITTRTVFGLRAYGSVGSECRRVFDSHIAAAGPMLQVRVSDSFWVGAGLYGGHGETCRLDEFGAPNRVFDTDIVFSPVFDLSYAVTSRRYGQWLVSAGVGYFFATPSNDNRLIYTPIGFGPRFF